MHLSKWEQAPAKLQKQVDLAYSGYMRKGVIEFADGDSTEAKDIFSDKDRSILLPNGRVVNVLQWAAQLKIITGD